MVETVGAPESNDECEANSRVEVVRDHLAHLVFYMERLVLLGM